MNCGPRQGVPRRSGGQPLHLIYCSIAAAVAQRGGPGTIIYVKPGVYRRVVTLLASGASGNPMVIEAQGGPVVVDGADDFASPSKWVLSSGSVYLASSVTWRAKQVFVDGARLAPSTADPACRSTRSGTSRPLAST